MPMPEPGAYTLELKARMTAPSHCRLAGAPVDPTRIDALALGDLWALAHENDRRDAQYRPIWTQAAQTARAILPLRSECGLALRGAAFCN